MKFNVEETPAMGLALAVVAIGVVVSPISGALAGV